MFHGMVINELAQLTRMNLRTLFVLPPIVLLVVFSGRVEAQSILSFEPRQSNGLLAAEDHKLAAIQLAPVLTFGMGKQSFDLKPSVQAQKNFEYGDITVQIRIDLNAPPRPDTGAKQALDAKLMPGTAGANVGVKYSLFPASWNKGDGTTGFEFRGAATFAYQAADVADTTFQSANSAVGNVEFSAAAWLQVLYVGAQGSCMYASGESSFATAVGAHHCAVNGVLVVALRSPGDPDKKTFYLQGYLGGDKSGVLYGVRLAGSFEPF